MNGVRITEPLYLPWSMQVRLTELTARHCTNLLITQQVYAQAKQERLWGLFYDHVQTGHTLCAVEPWMDTFGTAETALSMSCQARHSPAFPEVGEGLLSLICVRCTIEKFSLNLQASKQACLRCVRPCCV